MIATLRKLGRLDRERRAALAEAALLHAAVAIAIRVVPWRAMRRFTTSPDVVQAFRPAATADPKVRTTMDLKVRTTVDVVAWAVTTVAVVIPVGSTCLTRAIAADLMLKRRGFESVLVFGVAHHDGPPRFHAWVECHGGAIVGGEECDAYASLSATAARIANSTALPGN